MAEVFDTYAGLKSKHGLPDFNKIDSFFEINKIENDKYLLREIRRKIHEKLLLYADLLEEVLQPEQSVGVMHECRVITDEDKKKITMLYTKLMHLDRTSSLIEVYNKDEENIAFIKEVYNSWPELQKSLHEILSILKESWTAEETIDEDLRYLG